MIARPPAELRDALEEHLVARRHERDRLPLLAALQAVQPLAPRLHGTA